MTYKELMDELNELSKDQLEMEVSICNEDSDGECTQNIEFCINNSTDEFELEPNQPYFLSVGAR